MHSVIRVMCVCYSILLMLYTRRLRDVYGQEMVDVLREQMLEALQTSGRAGLLRPAGRAVGELVTIAVPSRLNKDFAVISLAACTSSGMLFALCRVLLNQDILDPWMRVIGLQCR